MSKNKKKPKRKKVSGWVWFSRVVVAIITLIFVISVFLGF